MQYFMDKFPREDYTGEGPMVCYGCPSQTKLYNQSPLLASAHWGARPIDPRPAATLKPEYRTRRLPEVSFNRPGQVPVQAPRNPPPDNRVLGPIRAARGLGGCGCGGGMGEFVGAEHPRGEVSLGSLFKLGLGLAVIGGAVYSMSR